MSRRLFIYVTAQKRYQRLNVLIYNIIIIENILCIILIECSFIQLLLQGNIHLHPVPISNEEKEVYKSNKSLFSNTEIKVWPGLKSNDKCSVVVRVYILKAHNLHPCDINGLSDPYVEIIFGKSHRISDHKNYIPKSLNPMFGKQVYQLKIKLKNISKIYIP